MKKKLLQAIALLITVITVFALFACGMGDMKPMYPNATPDTGGSMDSSEDTNDEYREYEELGFILAEEYPLSSFTANVNTASYTRVRDLIQSGQSVPSDAVRAEEFINYFKYNVPEPEAGEVFGVVTEMGHTPWNEESYLLRISLKARETERKAAHYVFLMDISGSMTAYNKLPYVKRSLGYLIGSMSEYDRLTVITYSYESKVLFENKSVADAAEMISLIEKQYASGATYAYNALEQAYGLAHKYFIPGGNNRVMIATDGDFNVGPTSDDEFTELVQSLRQECIEKEQTVYLTTLGYGDGNLHDSKLDIMAQYGDGNYIYVDSIGYAETLFSEKISHLTTVAKDVKLQVDFNPALVKGYRIIGYDTRQISSDDFENDQTDGGEVGAGQRVTVLYEVIPQGSDFEIAPTGRPSGDTSTTASDFAFTFRIKYKDADREGEIITKEYAGDYGMLQNELSEDYRFLCSLTEFAMILRNSKYIGSTDITLMTSYNRIKELNSVNNDREKQELAALILSYASRL
ncbi:MAG: von Willebrand factor type A domain-containing protein [Clostridia bacterium]|nr:von Willebrand factor type A domain-containing protein [Clostridia bacterium]